MNQRWLYGQDRYRPAGETINTRLYDVAPIGTKQAKAFVQTHHYSGPNSWVYDRFRFGLFTAGRLVGCAVFSHPVNEKIFSFFPGSVRQSVELGRFVLLDEVPGNGETFFLGRYFDKLRRAVDTKTGELLNMQGVVSFSDPSARTTATGLSSLPAISEPSMLPTTPRTSAAPHLEPSASGPTATSSTPVASKKSAPAKKARRPLSKNSAPLAPTTSGTIAPPGSIIGSTA